MPFRFLGCLLCILLWGGFIFGDSLAFAQITNSRSYPPPPASPAAMPNKPATRRVPSPATRIATTAPRPQSDPMIERRHIIKESTLRYTVNVEYPSIGAVLVDSDLAHWARQQVDIFISGIADIPQSDPSHFTLNISYQRSQPTLRYASFIFTIETLMGNEPPETGLMTFTYHVQEGKKLRVEDLFQKPDGLIHFFSTYARRHLGFKEWQQPDATYIERGTAAHPMNFMFFAVTPKGLTLYFPPKQVAPASEGCIALPIPIQDLIPFSPNQTLWKVPPPHKSNTSTKP